MRPRRKRVDRGRDRGFGANAVADYRPDEHRYIKRCQVMANRYSTPRPITSTRGLSCGGPPADTGDARPVTSGAELSTRHTRASGTSQWTVSLAA